MLDPLRILGSVAASSGVGRAGHQRGVTWRPRPSQEPKAGQGDGDTKAGAAMGRDSDQKLCVCVPPTSTQSFTPMFVHVHVFILFGLWGVFFLFSSFPVCNLSHFHLFSFFWQAWFCPLLFSLSPLSISVFISVFSSPASPSATLPCIPQSLFLCLSS